MKYIFMLSVTAFSVLSGYAQNVGIGTTTPASKFEIAGTGTYNLTGSYSDFKLGNATYHIKMGVANAGGGAGDAYIAGSNRLYLGVSTDFSKTQLMSLNSNGRIGIGTYLPAARMHIIGDTFAVPTLQVTTAYAGNSDVRGIISYSKPADGYGYGVEATGGYYGGAFYGNGGTYAGGVWGVYGSSTGTTGTRYGVYGTASGGTENWGGYFPAKTYTSELRVGGTAGASGYVASINGKLIATEVRVQTAANWPDYVFGSDYNLMPLDELERKINADKHLPGVPAACDMNDNGIMLGAMQTTTMQKLEENTLYIIQLNNKVKEIDQLNDKIKELEKKIEELAKLVK